MNLLYLNNVIAGCPALDKPMSLTDEIDLIRITVDPECIPNDTHHELLAMLAGDYNLPHFGSWEDGVEFAVCFTEEEEDVWNPILEASTANGESVSLDIDATPEELATLYLPLLNPVTYNDKEARDDLAKLMQGLRYGNYDEMIQRSACATVCLLYAAFVRKNPLLSILPGFDEVLMLSIKRRVPMVVNIFVDFCNAVKTAAKV